jgi:type II secretory pathway component PulJ
MDPEPDRDECGATLIEVLVAVVLLGIGTVGILAALSTSIKLSTVQRRQVSANAALAIAAEAIASANTPYAACAGADTTSGAYRQAIESALAQARNPQRVTFTVRYWNGGQGSGFDTTCRDGGQIVPAYEQLQLISLSTPVTGSGAWTLDVVKRPV